MRFMAEKTAQLPFEEFWNSFTHMIGALLAMAGTGFLLSSATGEDFLKTLSLGLYGVSLVVLYCSSAFYHILRGDAKRIFRKLDHINIYLLIAGTYTPIMLVVMQEQEHGHSLLLVVWMLAFGGIFLEFSSMDKSRYIAIAIYIIMGWLVVMVSEPLLALVSYNGFLLIVYGGLSYTGGVIFYLLGRKIRYFHAIWHLFVLLGSLFHYCFIFFYIA